MSNAVFNFPVDSGAREDVQFNSLTVSFGDGYEQEIGVGINNRKDQWDIGFKGTDAEVAPILAFFDAHGVPDTFLWSPPGRPQARYKTRGYSVTHQHAGIKSYTAVFVRTFAP